MKNHNIIFVLLDGFRRDRLDNTVYLKKATKDGLFLSNMTTAVPYTSGSINAMFTGMYGSKNGVDSYNKTFNLKEDCKMLTEYLKEKGYHTSADVVSKTVVNPRAFDKLTIHDEKKDDITRLHLNMIEKEMNRKESPSFLFLQYSGIHNSTVTDVFDKYNDFSKEYFLNKKENISNYNSYLRVGDSYFNEIYESIKKHESFDDTIVLFFSDHGMGNGEKIGERGYGVFTYDYSIKTFGLLINKNLFPSQRFDKLCSNIDLMPTILDLLDINPDISKRQMQGKSFSKYIAPSFFQRIKNNFSQLNDNSYTYTETGGLYGPWPSPDKPNVRCIRTDKWKLIHNETPDTWELYDLIKDPNEIKNIFGFNPKIESNLLKKLKVVINDCNNN